MATTNPGQSAESVVDGNVKIETTSTNEASMAEALKDLWGASQTAEGTGKPEELTAWSVVLDAAKDFDKDLVGNWKDDMSNMLIFAGLFSTVVTSFVIVSYSWLQEDSSDTSARLLAQISQQLSSLNVNGGFINSTVPAATPEPFVPTHVAVRVNTLWFLSLAMSLIAALFAIITQQWMRAYQDLGYLSLREAVRLRELRYRNLHYWRVPEIINCVPILLQAALVLFLTGIWIILQPLNDTVFAPYATFIAVSFFIFATTVLMSMVSPSCAYKSPLSYCLSVALKASVVSAYCFILGSIYLVMGTVQVFVVIYRNRNELDTWMLHLEAKLSTIASKMSKAVSKLPLDSSSTAVEYWLARERSSLKERKDLDSTALSWVLPWLSETSLASLTLCLNGLETAEEKLNVVGTWLARSLNFPLHTKYPLSDYAIASLFDKDSTVSAMKRFGERYHKLLLDLLPDVWHNNGARSSEDEPLFKVPVLALLRHFARTNESMDASFKENYTKKVMRLRESQASVSTTSHPEHRLHEIRLPTVALFECSTVLRYDFNDDEMSTLLKWSKELYDNNRNMPRRLGAPNVWMNNLELLLASSATASDAISRRPKVLETGDMLDRYLTLLKDLQNLIHSEPRRIAALVSHAEHWLGKGVPSISALALESIAKSIIILSQAGYLHRREDCPSVEVVKQLHALFDGEERFKPLLPQLEELSRSFKVPSPSDKSAADVVQVTKEDTELDLAYDNTRIEKVARDEPR
ncbi:hypothetical protein NM688_g1466 [Phlebia brevispora]|uniref:Uncharacterized protein n=1 Tax=Phlebia brevispora TaxID=194682 RepID=A0ACC1TBG5_9APHY|nr:hypothetical protein NM688_g1466 [Phlebia brevispora]